MQRLITHLTENPKQLYPAVLIAVLLLPVALWLDLHRVSHHDLHRHANGLLKLVSELRPQYPAPSNAPALSAPGTLHYQQAPTIVNKTSSDLTIEALLGQLSEIFPGSEVRFVHVNTASELSDFEHRALEAFRNPETQLTHFVQEGGGLLGHRLTKAAPLYEDGALLGVQIVQLRQPLSLNLSSFMCLIGYMLIMGTFMFAFARHQLQLAGKFRETNKELSEKNTFLDEVSRKISKYLEPQVYHSIFAGERDASISTERKKLTVFFSDNKDFTATTERMQPEELTQLLNEYFSEMGQIAQKHGATIDKFIGDAIVAFFGDPSSQGPAEDARACVRMALEMQTRLDELEVIWRKRGIEHPFRARMGINTGYCNVGNFGSDTRMDYTIIGAEANLAARLESIAAPGGIVMSYETYAHARDLVTAEALPPQRFKGISREITPYRVMRQSESLLAASAVEKGDTLVVEMQGMDPQKRAQITSAVNSALKTL
jgi:class 3 adenylate cyclase